MGSPAFAAARGASATSIRAVYRSFKKGCTELCDTPEEAAAALAEAREALGATEASGALCDITVCEAININEVAANAAKIAAAYKGPGK